MCNYVNKGKSGISLYILYLEFFYIYFFYIYIYNNFSIVMISLPLKKAPKAILCLEFREYVLT